MPSRNRKPGGQPTGGQFAEGARASANVSLSGHTYTDDGFCLVSTVEEFNEAITRGDKSIELSFSDSGVIDVSDKPMRFRLREGANIKILQGDAIVELTGDSTAVVGGNIEVHASDRARVQAHQYARVLASGNAQVDVWDNAFVEASGRSMVRAQDGALVDATGEASVVAQDRATVSILSNGVTVTAMDRAEVQSFGDVTGRVIAVGNDVKVDHFDDEDETVPHPHHMAPVPKDPSWVT